MTGPIRILCVVERAGAKLDDSSWELLGAARAIAGDDGRVEAALVGDGVDALADELARGYDAVHVLDAPELATWNGDAYARLLAAQLAADPPALTLVAHTNLGIDLAPGLAARAGLALCTDCIELRRDADRWHAVRALHGGKVHARVTCGADGRGLLATLRRGAFPAATPGAEPTGAIQREPLAGEIPTVRRELRTVEPDADAVDIRSAAVLVSVGRGIGEEENLELARSLAQALGAELACSRPVVDKGWLPKSRQVGTSGVMVRPKVYVAIGLSGSFQHIGGIQGSPFVVAINKDPRAPIFAFADVGVVGDLFDVVPALEAKLRGAD